MHVTPIFTSHSYVNTTFHLNVQGHRLHRELSGSFQQWPERQTLKQFSESLVWPNTETILWLAKLMTKNNGYQIE